MGFEIPRVNPSSMKDGTAGPRKSTNTAAKIVEATGDLPAMPHIAAEVMEKLSSPKALPRDIHHLLTKDQGLAARVLKVANSPYYGASRSISSLRDAVLFMGFDSIKSVVLTAVMKGIFAETGLAEKLLWEHSVGCGLAARKIALAIGYSSCEEAFLAGMIHDLGKAILFQRVPAKMSAIMQEVYNGGT
ncbi:MAG: HDOD domain-containing protein, partial [Syntrophobacteraceae bacterium]